MLAFSIIIISAFVLSLLFQFEKTVIVMAVLSVVLQMPLVFGYSIFFILALISIVILLCKADNYRTIISYPFIWVVALTILTYIGTNLFSKGQPHWTIILRPIVCDMFFPLVFWHCLRYGKMSLRQLFAKCSLGFMMIFSIYGLFELLTNSNPIIESILNHKEMFSNNIGLSDRYRFGVRRLQSFFPFNGALGLMSNISIILVTYIHSKLSYRKLYNGSNYIFLLFILVLMSLFTGTRSVFVGLLFAVVYLWYFYSRSSKSLSMIVGVMTLFLTILISGDYFWQIFNSFSNTQSVGGSHYDMREGQFTLAYSFMSSAGFWGNGFGFTDSYVQEFYREDILGAESVWLPLMIDMGYAGVLVYALFLIYSLFLCLKTKSWAGVAVMLSFIATKTLTSAPGITNYYFLIYIIFYLAEVDKNKGIIERLNLLKKREK